MILQILKVILQAAKRVWNLPGQIVKTQISACIDNYRIRKGKKPELGKGNTWHTFAE